MEEKFKQAEILASAKKSLQMINVESLVFNPHRRSQFKERKASKKLDLYDEKEAEADQREESGKKLENGNLQRKVESERTKTGKNWEDFSEMNHKIERRGKRWSMRGEEDKNEAMPLEVQLKKNLLKD